MNETIKKLKCIACNYEWLPRKVELPKVCPNCKSRRWKDRVKRIKR